jgi:hypothetical protein
MPSWPSLFYLLYWQLQVTETIMLTCKVKLPLCLTNWAQCHEDQRSGCIDPCILDLYTSWRWVVSFTPQLLNLWPLPWGKAPRVHWIVGWVGCRMGLDSPYLDLVQLWLLSCPACRQLLYHFLSQKTNLTFKICCGAVWQLKSTAQATEHGRWLMNDVL